MHAIIAKSDGAQIIVHTPVLVTGWLAEFGDADPLAWLDQDPAHPNALGHLHMADHTLRTIGLDELSAL
jgi:hypothetical protein